MDSGDADWTSERRLRRAVEEKQFRLYYQPQIDQRTGRIVGAEALLRWLDPEEGLLSPGEFLTSLEATGLIVPVGEWAFRQATQDCERWQRLGLPRLRLGMNISPLQIHERVSNPQLLDTHSLRACCDLYLEIDGRQMSGAPPAVIKALHALQHEGIRISVQGFGVDESLRSRLWTLPVDLLKVDCTLVRRMIFDEKAERTVASLVALARAFRLSIVAECVETHEQLEKLEQLGCRHVQGFVYSAPLPAAGFEGLLEAACTLNQAGSAATGQMTVSG
jgi:EAL domain-containing protein (putative c-di-GMP-specific phosphodiesterase class I)